MSISAFSIPPADELSNSRHAAVGAWFFGPRAENFNHLDRYFQKILLNQRNARETTYPDGQFIDDAMKETALYQSEIVKLDDTFDWLTEWLSKTSVPFWSPRYNAHMSMESTMPSVVGYLAGLLHNQNNVATEASAMTTWLETKVGQSLCHMLGYNIAIEDPDDRTRSAPIFGEPVSGEEGDPTDDEPLVLEDRPTGWGHITCGGSVANLESIWAARNLKFYALSLKWALEDPENLNKSLSFLQNVFEIETCDGTKKLFSECSIWELLNLKPRTVLNIPTMLYRNFGISQNTLTKFLDNYTIQTLGKDFFEKKYDIKAAQLLVGLTRHYSWPKGAAIAGIGRKQVVNVDVDEKARMSPNALRNELEKALRNQIAVYMVVAIIGSTEHGAVDPLVEVLKIRQEFEPRGLTFVVHCDGAWGGYFTSCIREKDQTHSQALPRRMKANADLGFVPSMALTPYTRKQLSWFGRADSITIDPHKSGYCPYPAGGLCYRDGRMRYLVTWTSPVVFRGEGESIGVYGVEGSKPGAAAVGTFLSHKMISLDKKGYGTLLGEAIFTCAMLYCHWATMEFDAIPIKRLPGHTGRIVITPFTMLPAERDKKSKSEIEQQKQFIRDFIIAKTNREIFADKKASRLISELGGDLQINTFAVNFEVDGVLNTNIIEANYLNNRIFNRCSITDWQDTKKPLEKVKLFLTSTVFAQSDYKGCLDTYKKRLGLKGDQDLYTLINVTMNPWATASNFIQEMANVFRTVAEEELEYAAARNTQTKDHHGFYIQGIESDRVCGVHLPMFNMENHRWQLIISCKLPEDAMSIIRDRKRKDPKTWFTFSNSMADTLEVITKSGKFNARVDEKIPIPVDNKTPPPLIKCEVTDIKVLYRRSMKQESLITNYPDNMYLYAYSADNADFSSKRTFNVDHLLHVAINIQLNSDDVKIEIKEGMSQVDAENLISSNGVWLRLVDVHERVLQPLLQEPKDPNTIYDKPGLGWKAGATYTFEALQVHRGVISEVEEVIAPDKDDAVIFTGQLTLGTSVFADALMINGDVEEHEEHQHSTDADGEDADAYHPRGAFSVLGLQQSNASGLVAEYPNPLQMPELRLRNQANRMQMFKSAVLSNAPKEVAYTPFGGSLRS